MTIGIYKITNKINDKVYIGKSVNIEKRWRDHRSALNRDDHGNDHLQSSLNIYGFDAFSFEIIKECEPEYLDEFEKFYIAFYDAMNPDHGYNMTEGGDGTHGYQHTEEWKKKHSESLKGRKHSEQTKKKISESHTGKSLSPEHRRKLSESHKGQIPWMKGKTHSEETRKKISEANKGKLKGKNHPQSKYILWNNAKCQYHKGKMYEGNRDGSAPCRCFITKYNGKQLLIGRNLDFLTCEIIHDLIEEAL